MQRIADEAVQVRDLAERLAREAGRIQRERYETSFEIRKKGETTSLVTDVDHACEALIVEALGDLRPGDAVLAEEGSGTDRADAPWRWIVDPLDGTTNFAHGYPRFCVSIGVEHEGSREVGVVYDATRDELFRATRGGGAWLGDRRLRVSSETRLDRSLVATGFAYDIHAQSGNEAAFFAHMLRSVRGLRRDGSAALDLCYVAAGRFDAYWEHRLHPWDVAAGLLIVEEAGGRVSDVEGGPAPASGASVVATNGSVHEELLGALGQVRP